MPDVEAENSILSRTYIRYSIAVVAVAVAFLFREAAVHFLGHELPVFIIFYPAVMLVATLCGLWPGMLATGLSALVSVYWIMPPRGSFAIENATDVIILIIFLGMGVFMSLVAAAYRRNQKQVVTVTRELVLRENQEKLRQSEKQYEDLANAIPQLCWMANRDGWIFWYNQRWYSYTGTTPQQMEGWGWQSVHHPDTLPKVIEKWKASIATAEPFDMIFPIRGGDGEFRPFLTRVMPVKDSAGEVVRWFGTNTDISEQKKIEAELRKSKERRDLVVEVAGLGEWEVDLKGHTTSHSRRHDEIFGYTSADHEWSLDLFLSHVLPQYRAEIDEKVKASLQGGSWDIETQIRREDGEVRWIWARGRSVLDELGQPARMFGTVMDVTARKQAEEALRRQADMLRLSFDAIIVWRLDGGIESWNHGATQLYGYNELEARGRITHDLLRTIHPEPWSRMEAKLREHGHWEGELRHFTKDGREITVSARLQFIVGDDGIQRVLESNRDITERKQAEETKARLAAIVESSADAIIGKSLDGIVSSWNHSAEQLFGYSAEEMIGHSIDVIIPPDHRDEEAAILDHLRRGDCVDRLETVRLDKSGRSIDVSLTTSPIRDAYGTIVGASKNVRDITERKRAQEQLRQLNRTLKALSNSNHSLSHVSSEPEFLQQVCRIISEDCGHPLVWIGFAEDDQNNTVRPVAHAGFEEGYLETLRITWDDSERGRGPTGTAIRTGQWAMCRNMNADRAFLPWREQATKRGYAASLAIPISNDGKPFGAITIYSRVPDAFSEAEVNLLTELANDLSHGISVLRLRAAHARAEEVLKASELRYRDLAESIPALLWAADAQGVTTDHNQKWHDYTGQPHEKGRGDGWKEIVHPDDAPRVVEAWTHAIRTGEHYYIEYRIRRASDGTFRWHAAEATLRRDEQGNPLGWFGTLTDIESRKQAEQGLQSSQAKLNSIVSSAMDAIISVDDQHRIVVFNRAAEQVFGCAASEALGSTLDRFIPKKLREVHQELIRRFGIDGTSARSMGSPGILTAIRSDGEEFPIEATISKADADGHKLYTVILRDITERRQAEVALQTSEERYRNLFNNMSEGFCIIEMIFDAEGKPADYRFLQVNPAFERQTRLHDAEGKLMRELAPDHEAHWFETYGRVALTGESIHFVNEAKALNRWYHVHAYPVGEPELRRVAIIFTDFSDFQQAQQALQASEQRWATTLRSIGDAVISTDVTGKIEFMNEVAQELTGWSLADAKGNDLDTVFNIIHEVKRTRPESPVAKVLRLRMVVGLANHTSLIRRDGTEIPVEDSGAPIRNKAGEIEGVVLVFHDVTEQRRVEKALRDSERLATTGRLAATIAHEIHNPLDAVGNLIYLIGLDAHDDATREYVAIASKELTRVSQLTRQMLTFQREAASPVPVKIGEILDNVAALYERKITTAGIKLKQQVDFDGHILALPGEMRQVFANLVGNAIEAVVPRHGTITIRAYASQDWQRDQAGLRVVVADNGPGIPTNVRNRIFEPFFTTKGESGTGLGLWITADILRKYNATMRLRTSTHPPNSGTCFSVFFPFEKAAD